MKQKELHCLVGSYLVTIYPPKEFFAEPGYRAASVNGSGIGQARTLSELKSRSINRVREDLARRIMAMNRAVQSLMREQEALESRVFQLGTEKALDTYLETA